MATLNAALCAVGSLKLTLILLGILLLVAAGVVWEVPNTSHGLIGCFGGLAVNLTAALWASRPMRANAGLFLFHVGLLLGLVLLALGQLTQLRGAAEVVTGETFQGELIFAQKGWWHNGALDEIRFINDGFTIDYLPGNRRRDTRNSVRVLREQGRWERSVIGDDVPLISRGYRFYTTSNKGFAATFDFVDLQGNVTTSVLSFPSYPRFEDDQTKEWRPAGVAATLWMKLQLEEPVLNPDQPSVLKLPKRFHIVVREGERRWELRPADGIELPEGRLVLASLTTWMGYSVFYDWTIPWLIAVSVVALLGLAWHAQIKYFSRPWRSAS